MLQRNKIILKSLGLTLLITVSISSYLYTRVCGYCWDHDYKMNNEILNTATDQYCSYLNGCSTYKWFSTKARLHQLNPTFDVYYDNHGDYCVEVTCDEINYIRAIPLISPDKVYWKYTNVELLSS